MLKEGNVPNGLILAQTRGLNFLTSLYSVLEPVPLDPRLISFKDFTLLSSSILIG